MRKEQCEINRSLILLSSRSDWRRRWAWLVIATIASLILSFAAPAYAADGWIAVWTAAQQGAFAAPTGPAALSPIGEFQPNIYFAQPNAIRFALPNGVATDQSLRMVVRPNLFGETARVRFSNVFGKGPLAIDAAAIGLQEYGANVIPGTSVKITFNGGQPTVSIPAGQRIFSDPIRLPFVEESSRNLLRGRNVAVSFAIKGSADALSYHDSAYQTSYVAQPNSGDHTQDVNGAAFLYTTTSWFIVDAIDVMAPAGTPVIVVFGDSISDGTFSTNNANDRWPDALAYRLHETMGDKVSLVNEAINGNAVAASVVGEPAVKRLDRDILGVSGVTTVILLEGVNDLAAAPDKLTTVVDSYRDIVARLHKAGVRVIAGTLTPGYLPDQDFAASPLGSKFGPAYGGSKANDLRKLLNEAIRSSKIFDGVVDFEAATIDPASGALRQAFAPNSMGGPGDYLHPNRTGYQAMGEAIPLELLIQK